MDERSTRIARRFEVPMLVAALLVISVIVIEESNVSDTWKTVGGTLNWAIWITFALEVIVMLAVVPSWAVTFSKTGRVTRVLDCPGGVCRVIADST
jgi:uncharacterized membrane protein YbhN (UPF0104 family)